MLEALEGRTLGVEKYPLGIGVQELAVGGRRLLHTRLRRLMMLNLTSLPCAPNSIAHAHTPNRSPANPYYPCMCVIGTRDVVRGDSPPAARPQHFWACELGDADGKGSPILHEYTKKSEYFTLKNGDKVRGGAGDCLLLLRRYYHRAVEDTNGLTFKRWEEKKGEILVVNSSELRAVQGRQANDFMCCTSHQSTQAS